MQIYFSFMVSCVTFCFSWFDFFIVELCKPVLASYCSLNKIQEPTIEQNHLYFKTKCLPILLRPIKIAPQGVFAQFLSHLPLTLQITNDFLRNTILTVPLDLLFTKTVSQNICLINSKISIYKHFIISRNENSKNGRKSCRPVCGVVPLPQTYRSNSKALSVHITIKPPIPSTFGWEAALCQTCCWSSALSANRSNAV